MIQISDLPTLNACLNAFSFCLLLAGYLSIRKNSTQIHRLFMLSALGSSALFLASYLVYHYHVGSKSYEGEGPVRVLYFAILLTHTVLAIGLVPLVFTTLIRAFKGRFSAHRRIARWTLPIWAYVSVTGVVIYLMLYGIRGPM